MVQTASCSVPQDERMLGTSGGWFSGEVLGCTFEALYMALCLEVKSSVLVGINT